MKQCHIFISGFVQGVGFRHFIKSKARELNLTGWVQNLPDGRVGAVFQGSKSSIEQIIKHCRKGPFLSEVEEVQAQWSRAGSRFAGEKSKKVYKDFEML